MRGVGVSLSIKCNKIIPQKFWNIIQTIHMKKTAHFCQVWFKLTSAFCLNKPQAILTSFVAEAAFYLNLKSEGVG